jgi:predicted small lipoprotein YifL
MMYKNYFHTIFLLLILLLAVSGCGKRGLLFPPEALVPASVSDLKARQVGEDFQVAWSAPSKDARGATLSDLSGFQLFKRQFQTGEENCAACDDSWKLIADIDKDYPKGVAKIGNRFVYTNSEVAIGDNLQYKLFALSKSGGISKPAVTTVMKKQEPLSPPTIKVEASVTGVLVEVTLRPKDSGKDIAYNIYRRKTGESVPFALLNKTSLTSNNWEDTNVEIGQTYYYSATTVLKTSAGEMESLRSSEVSITFKLPPLE